MTNIECTQLVNKYWRSEWADKQYSDPPPEAKFRTGNGLYDACFHYLETEAGVDISVTDDKRCISSFNIIDKEKFLIFVLKWS